MPGKPNQAARPQAPSVKVEGVAACYFDRLYRVPTQEQLHLSVGYTQNMIVRFMQPGERRRLRLKTAGPRG